jgi:hypothetical protein
MNRIAMTAAAALLAWLALSSGTLASHSDGPGQGSPRDFAVGTGEGSIGRVSFAAHGGPSPDEPVTGHFHAKGALLLGEIGEFDLEGPVTCLEVDGNQAGLFYPVRDPDPPEPNGVFVYLEDNGNPASGDPPDKIGFVPSALGDPPPPRCPFVATSLNVESGNFTIHDAE